MILSGLILLYVMIVAFALCVSVSIRDEYALGLHPYINDKAERWIQALESGGWEQTKGVLNSGGAYCCLGVACELDDLFNGSKLEMFGPQVAFPATWGHNFNKTSLPIGYSKELGLLSSEGDTLEFRTFTINHNEYSSLVSANDDGCSFKQIAHVLRTQPELFFQKRF